MAYVTIKVHEDTRLQLRIIAAVTGEQMVQVLDRLCRVEVERVIETWPEGKLLIIHGSKKEGKSYVDRFAQPLDNAGEKGSDDDDATGTSSDSDTRSGGDMAGDDAI